MKNLFFSYSLLFLTINQLNAAGFKASQFPLNQNKWSFVENKGQVASPDPLNGDKGYELHPEIVYYGRSGNVNLFFRHDRISFVFTKIEKKPAQISEATGLSSDYPKGNSKFNIPAPARTVVLSCGRAEKERSGGQNSKFISYRADLVLLGSNPNARITATNQQEYYENFYLAHTPQEGITHVNTFKSLTYHNIYPNIDLVLSASRASGMKYSFCIFPGGNINDIQMHWDGPGALEANKEGSISYNLSSGWIKADAPFGDRKNDVIRISNHENRIGFITESQDPGKALVIGQVLSWGTYFGGEDWENSSGIALDGKGDVFITGATISVSGIATSGAFQTTFGGGKHGDAFLAKFSNTGKLLWATYFGGTGTDFGNGIVTDAAGNAYIIGGTESNYGIATTGAYNTDFTGIPGTMNAFLAKFSGTGTRTWATYYGGRKGEGYSITTDNTGHLFITGSLGNAAFISKFTFNGGHIWSHYIGTKGETEGRAITLDGAGNVIITGSTTCNSGIATKGAYQANFGGGSDAFIASFNINGTQNWITYLGGKGDDEGDGIAADGLGNIFICGWTLSDSAIATSGAYQSTIGGASDGFISRFSKDGKMIWSTYYGGANSDNAATITFDHHGDLLVTGSASSLSGIASMDAYQSTIGGSGDAFIARFNTNGMKQWATYYGGIGTEWSRGIAVDGSGNIFITGNLMATASGIATKGAYQESLHGQLDAFLARFSDKK